MRKSLKPLRATFFLFLASGSAFGLPTDHLSEINSKFPYGLLGDDYGVLSVNDLALNACHFKPEPFVSNLLTPYEYWQCFANESISLSCNPVGSLEDVGGPAARVVVWAHKGQVKYEFFEQRPWSLKSCKNFVRDLRKLMNGTTHSCISASYFGGEVDKSDNKLFTGLLNRFKTRKGCEGEACEFTDKVRREYCPDLKT